MPISSTARQARRDATQTVASSLAGAPLSRNAQLKQASRDAIAVAVEQLAAQGQVFSSITKAIQVLVAQASSENVTTKGCRKHQDLLQPVLAGVKKPGRRARRRKAKPLSSSN